MKINISKAFLGARDMGEEAPRRCAKCRGCTQRSLSGQLQTEKEAREYQMITGGIRLNEETNKFEVEYSFIDDPKKLSNNFRQSGTEFASSYDNQRKIEVHCPVGKAVYYVGEASEKKCWWTLS